jgi:Rieske Fe-S protein
MSKWGLANGVAAGSILRDLIVSGESALESNPYAKLVDARRWDLLHSLPGMAQAGVHTAAHLVMDHAKAHLMAHDIATLKRGEGGLVRIKGESVGAYLDEEGKYHLIKPVCTHMGCAVVFNQGDKVWDCPCHGSQFTVDGDVIQGPVSEMHQTNPCTHESDRMRCINGS